MEKTIRRMRRRRRRRRRSGRRRREKHERSNCFRFHASSPMVDSVPLAVVRLIPWNPTWHKYMPSSPSPMSVMLRTEVFWPVIRLAGLSNGPPTHVQKKVRALAGEYPIVVQLKKASVPRSTTTSPTEATEGR